MKPQALIRIVVIVCIVLVCTGFAVFSYLRLNTADRQKDFNLYALVPQNAVAVLETDRMAGLVEDINGLACSKDNHFLYASELFVCLKKYLHLLIDDTPHGLSKQMNKMLLSFHEPDTPTNQVLYCSLGVGDAALVERVVQKYCANVFPSKEFQYRDEKIRIYSMADGRFLAFYLTEDFLVASFQKRLVEQVIDARQGKRSLLDLASFRQVYTGKHSNVAATVYVRTNAIGLGMDGDRAHATMRLGSWAEFDMLFDKQAIYCSGISHGSADASDTAQTFTDVLRRQQPLTGFPGEQLPATTFYHNCLSVTDQEAIQAFASRQSHAQASQTDEVQAEDAKWKDYLARFAGGNALYCLFRPAPGTQAKQPCAVLRIPLAQVREAREKLFTTFRTTRIRKSVHPTRRTYPYRLPDNSLLSLPPGAGNPGPHTYVCFYRDALLIAPDIQSLSAYVKALEAGETLAGSPWYEMATAGLVPTYNYAMMGDIGAMAQQPAGYTRLVPRFFFRQSGFFRHFILSIQFTCADDGTTYSNIVLLYKGEED